MKLAAGVALAAGAVLLVVALAGGGGEDDPAPGGAPAPRGLAVFAAHGCGSCHTFATAGATGTVAPDLTVSLDGKPAAFIRESIVDPAAAAEPGWSGDTMPGDYGRRIAPADLDALVAFLAAG